MFRLLTLRSLRTRPARMLLSMLGIVLGVAGIMAIGMVTQTALDSVRRVFSDASGKANLVITSAETDGGSLSQGLLRRVAAVEGVALALPKLQQQAQLASDAPLAEMGLSFFGASTGGLSLQGIDPELDTQVRSYKLVAGRFLSANAPEPEVVFVDTFASEKEIELGSRVKVATPAGAAELLVVGLMAKEGPGLQNNGAFGVLSLDEAQKLFDRQGELDSVDVLASPDVQGSAGLEQLKARLESTLGDEYAVTYPAAQGRRMEQMLGSYQIGLSFLSGIALFVGAFLIYNAFSMSLAERTRELGMLRTVGMTRRQVALQVLGEAAVLGVVGSLVGLGVGALLARGLAGLMATLLAQDMTRVVMPPGVVVTSAVVGLLATVLAAMLPAWQASRTSPLEALRSRARANEGWLIRNGWQIGLPLLAVSAAILILNPFPYDVQFRMGSLVVFTLFGGATLMIPASVSPWERLTRPVMKLLYGSSGRLGSGNIQRARMRTTLTVAALMISVAMVIVVRAMTASFRSDLEGWLRAYVGGDLYVGSSLPMRSRVWNHLQSVEGVDAVAPIRYLDANWEKPDGSEEKLVFMAIDPAVHGRVTSFLLSGEGVSLEQALQRLQAGDAVMVSSVLSEKYDLQPGDSMWLRTRGGAREFQIAAVIVDFYNQGLVVTGSWDDMRRYFRVSDASAYLLKVQSGYSVEDVRQRVDELYGRRDNLILESNQGIKQRIFRLMGQAFSMFDVLALIAVVVAALGVINTLTMNVMERTQEIGMLRGVGLTRRQVMAMVLSEAAVMGIISGLLGLVFGVILSRIFLTAMTAMSGYKLSYVLPWQGIAISLLISVIISQLAAILPARRAARLRIMEAIHYE